MTEIRPEPLTIKGTADETKAMDAHQLDAHSDIRERIARLEEATKHFATKADVVNVKVWALGGLAGALLAVVLVIGRMSFFP